MNTASGYDLFISYAEADQAWVEDCLLPALGIAPERLITERTFRPGAAVVEEFERAVKSSRYTVLVLSPAYLRDKWAAFGGQLSSYASVVEQRDRLIPLLRQPCELPLNIEFRVRLDCTSAAPAVWASEFARLRALLELPEPPASAPTSGEPPFKGLQYFDEADADLFFGRERLTAKLVAYLSPHPPLLAG